MSIFAGDELYGDDVTSGPLDDEPLERVRVADIDAANRLCAVVAWSEVDLDGCACAAVDGEPHRTGCPALEDARNRGRGERYTVAEVHEEDSL